MTAVDPHAPTPAEGLTLRAPANLWAVTEIATVVISGQMSWTPASWVSDDIAWALTPERAAELWAETHRPERGATVRVTSQGGEVVVVDAKVTYRATRRAVVS